MKQIKIMQFGEGKFLRAFCDVVIQRANNNMGYQKYVIDMIQPLEFGELMKSLATSEFKYMVNEVNESLKIDNEVHVDCINSGVDPYDDFQAFKKLCVDKDLKYIFSNTTESGIAYVKEELVEDKIMLSFPGKVLQMLYFRYNALGSDAKVIFIPSELIEENSKTLKKILLVKARDSGLDQDFINYIESCDFHDTLVDRIVVGYSENKYEDKNFILCEPFMKWVIDGITFDFVDDANIEGIILDNVIVHRELKVKILNGIHTAITPFAILNDVQYVHLAFENEMLNSKIEALLKEILNTIDLEGKEKFAQDVIDRFKNPKLNHKFTDIMLNSLDKFVARNYPSLIENLDNSYMPKELLNSLCAIVVQYKCGYPINDQQNIELWEELELETAAQTLTKYKFKELEKYPEAMNYINQTVKELSDEYGKSN